jgi:hypothetical protein
METALVGPAIRINSNRPNQHSNLSRHAGCAKKYHRMHTYATNARLLSAMNVKTLYLPDRQINTSAESALG